VNNEKRSQVRWELPRLGASLQIDDKDTFDCLAYDISRVGMSLAFTKGRPEIVSGLKVKVSLFIPFDGYPKRDFGKAYIVRKWKEHGPAQSTDGVSVRFLRPLPEEQILSFAGRNHLKENRIRIQHEIAKEDQSLLCSHRQSLHDCQVNLFILALTVSSMLATVYFTLAYQNSLGIQSIDPSLSFWRTLIAALPGMLSLACAAMVTQKSISIQRIDAYLSIIKECMLQGEFPIHYHGWETESRKLRHIINSSICDNCERVHKCGTVDPFELRALKSKPLLRGPIVDLYYIILFGVLFGISFTSSIAVLTEVLRFQLSSYGYMALSVSVLLVFCGCTTIVLAVLYNLRKGKYSVRHLRKCWLELFMYCRHSDF
jgi:hypothetical protein